MAKYNAIIGERVKSKIEELKDFFANQKSGRDTDFLEGLWNCLEALENNPYQWQYLNTQKEGIRRAIISSPQVIVYYKVDGNDVLITNVLHSRSNRKLD